MSPSPNPSLIFDFVKTEGGECFIIIIIVDHGVDSEVVEGEGLVRASERPDSAGDGGCVGFVDI